MPSKASSTATRSIAYLATLFCAMVVVLYPVFDYDLYWHLANGREMLAIGQIVNEERFSYTAYGTPFQNHEWLSQILFYVIYDRWGGTGLLVLKVCLSLLIVAVTYHTLRLLGARPESSAILAVSAVVAGLYRYIERPELFSLLGVAVLLNILLRFRTQKCGTLCLGAIPVCMVVWDWLHGAIFGVIVLCGFVGVENFKHWFAVRLPSSMNPMAFSSDRLRVLNVCFAVTIVAMLINPYGLLSYDIFIEFIRDNALVAQTMEFQPANWDDTMFWILLCATGLSLAATYKTIDLALLVVTVPFAYLAIRYSRVIGVFSLVDVVFLASTLASLEARFRNTRRFDAWRAATIGVAGTSLLVYMAYIKFLGPQTPQSFGYHVSDEFLPAGSVRFVEDTNLGGNLYNSGKFGGYLAYFITPERKIFQYNHHTVFGDTTRFTRDPSELEKWNINYAIIGDPAELERTFPIAEWARVYREAPAVVVVRRALENADFISRHEISVFHPMLSAEQLRRVARQPESFLRLIYEMALYLAYREDSSAADVFSELVFYRDDVSNAERAELLRHAARFNSGNPRLADALHRTGEGAP